MIVIIQMIIDMMMAVIIFIFPGENFLGQEQLGTCAFKTNKWLVKVERLEELNARSAQMGIIMAVIVLA